MVSDIDKLIYGLQVTIVGMGIVFLILYIISLVLDIMKHIFNKKQKPSSEPSQIKKEIIPEPTEEKQDDTQLIAVITAAIAHTIKKPTTRFRVTKITRHQQTTPIWGMASRPIKQ
ncbi:MAG: OadG family protein [Firmicutes bacterium]|nr:OadG family protein [Bacillota bacterium]NPV44297.1 OadG family protein [Bacillota bacterium]